MVDAPRFGTDGIRGAANRELTPEVALALGRATVEVLGGDVVVVGSDPRRSGPMLEGALTAGICSVGVDVEPLGVVPTPAVAWAAADRKAPAAMISASHNPFGDNGIKVFAPGGMKLGDDDQAALEARYLALLAGRSAPEPGHPTGEVGTVRPTTGVAGWLDLVTGSVSGDALAGMRMVIDCANGAASELGPEPFRRLGADVVVIGDRPDGRNINAGFGSTATEALQAAVIAEGAAAGLAFDGDADRLIAVDDAGRVVDGDRVLALLAADWASSGRLTGNTVVVTVMTNLGFHRAMAAKGIEVVATRVGDRHVLEAIESGGLSLGGEQSGHVICRDLATTGDGVLTGVQLLDVVARSGRSLAELAAESMDRVPQVLRNVRLPGPVADPAAALTDRVAAIEAAFGDDGRVLVRASGTEPLLRIMVEHLDPGTADRACADLVAAAEAAFPADRPSSNPR
ncbi:MAG: phosphoglucosamine mutase [Actinomycetota bacterium]